VSIGKLSLDTHLIQSLYFLHFLQGKEGMHSTDNSNTTCMNYCTFYNLRESEDVLGTKHLSCLQIRVYPLEEIAVSPNTYVSLLEVIKVSFYSIFHSSTGTG